MSQGLGPRGGRLPIRVRVGGKVIAGTIHAISRRGVFLRTDEELAVGEPTQLIFYTTCCAALVVRGQVAWLEPQGGCGILFASMPAFAHTMLMQLIAPSAPGRVLEQAQAS